MKNFISTKFDPPAWIGSQIRRESLLSHLEQSLERRLTIIFAPAGYGKTSLLSQWRAELDDKAIKVGWLTVDRDDSDLLRLTQNLYMSFGGEAHLPPNVSEAERLPPRAAMSAIVQLLEKGQDPHVLIIDDLHKAASEPVLSFFEKLVRFAPPHCHFVIATRDYPAIGQSLLLAERQLLKLTVNDLRFSESEIDQFFQKAKIDVHTDTLKPIVERTEGWPIAVSLASLSLQKGVSESKLMGDVAITGPELARYLSEQVLEKLPDDIREIVLRTAILDTITGGLVDTLCDRNDGWAQLDNLEQQGVFLTPQDDRREHYRYHQMFAEHLREIFHKTRPDEYRNAQAKAAGWFYDNDSIADAVSHAILSDDLELVGDMIENAGGWRLIALGHQVVVEQALAVLPRAVINARPRLMLTEVYHKMKHGELRAAREAFDALTIDIADENLPPEFRTEIRVVGDTLSDYENQPVTFEDLIERQALLRKFATDDHLVYANISETIAAKYFEGGWLERALQPALEAREHYQACNSNYSDMFTRFLEARIKRAQGRAIEAKAILLEALEVIADSFGDRSDLAANGSAFLAELLYEENEIEEAQSLLDWALPHMEQSDAWVDVYAAAYFTQARLYASQGHFDKAFQVIARTRRTAQWRRLRQLEILADIWEVDLQISFDANVEMAQAMAAASNIDDFADAMEERSPNYRPATVAAILTRIRLNLIDGNPEAAMKDLECISEWATERGAGRLLIDVGILRAYAYLKLDKISESRAIFDEAIGTAMYQNVSRPFIDAQMFVRPCLSQIMDPDMGIDRFRSEFIAQIKKAIADFKIDETIFGPFNKAEAEVLYYLSMGYSNKEIARLIDMSPDTVKYRLKSVFKKIGVGKRRDAVRVAAERGLIPSHRDLVGQPVLS